MLPDLSAAPPTAPFSVSLKTFAEILPSDARFLTSAAETPSFLARSE